MKAIQAATEAATVSPGERPTGCAFLDEDREITLAASNWSAESKSDFIIHAELNALAESVADDHFPPVVAAVLHVSPHYPEAYQQSKPCNLCMVMLKLAGVKQLLYVNYGKLIIEDL